MGGEVVDELDRSRVELEGVEAQLRAIESGEEGSGRLGVNFGKFGFDAKLRYVNFQGVVGGKCWPPRELEGPAFLLDCCS